MSLTIDESFEYRHKKFDQGKRPRDESSNSSQSEEDEDQLYIDVETVEEEVTNTYYPTNDWNTTTTASTLSSPSPYKRPRTGSFASSTTSYSAFSPIPPPAGLERKTSTPMMMAASPPALEPTAAILPKISNETLASICKYHGNMVRKFPKKQRTPKEQERRDKNTIACRMSRRVKKLEHIAIEEQYKEFSQQTFEIIERAMRSTAYLHELMKLSNAIGEGEMMGGTTFFDVKREQSSGSTPEKKPFSIAYLVGNEEE